MSDTQQWFYTDAAGQQQGPLTGDQLQQFALSGHITTDTQVWTEGLEAWVSASQIEGIQFAAPAAQPTYQQPQAAAVTPYSAPLTQTGVAQDGTYPIPVTGKSSFTLYLVTTLVATALCIVGFIMASAGSASIDPESGSDAGLMATGIGAALALIGYGIFIVPAVLQLINLYRVWALLQPGGGSISPGKAVGFLFIPLFGMVWTFIVLFKLPGEWNSIVARFDNTRMAPRLSIGSAVFLIFLPIIGALIWNAEICKAITFMFNARTMPTRPAAPSGGLNLY